LRYVGKTAQGIKKRLHEHRNDALNRRRNSYSSKWLRKVFGFGFEPEVEIFEEVADGADWVEAEQFWIAYWRSLGCRLTNLTIGGEGLSGHKRPRDVIERGVAKRRGFRMSEEAKARMRAAWTPERKALHAVRQSQWKPKDATRRRMSESAIKRIRTPEEIARLTAHLRKLDRNDPIYRAKLSAGCLASWARNPAPRFTGKAK
jgi:hypothetical protein